MAKLEVSLRKEGKGRKRDEKERLGGERGPGYFGERMDFGVGREEGRRQEGRTDEAARGRKVKRSGSQWEGKRRRISLRCCLRPEEVC